MKKLNFLSLVLVLMFAFVTVSVVWAGSWANPTQPAPNGNPDAPINISNISQVKSGGLGLGGNLSVVNDSTFGYIPGVRGGVLVPPPTSYGYPAIQGITANWQGANLLLNPLGNPVMSNGLFYASNKLTIGSVPGDYNYSTPGNLNMGTQGAIGAALYCDSGGQNCFGASQVTGLLGGTTPPIPPPPGEETPPPSTTFQGQFTDHMIWYNANGDYQWNGPDGGATWTTQRPGVGDLPATIRMACPFGSRVISGGGTCRYSNSFNAVSSTAINQKDKNGDNAWYFGCWGTNGLFFGYNWDYVASMTITCAR